VTDFLSSELEGGGIRRKWKLAERNKEFRYASQSDWIRLVFSLGKQRKDEKSRTV